MLEWAFNVDICWWIRWGRDKISLWTRSLRPSYSIVARYVVRLSHTIFVGVGVVWFETETFEVVFWLYHQNFVSESYVPLLLLFLRMPLKTWVTEHSRITEHSHQKRRLRRSSFWFPNCPWNWFFSTLSAMFHDPSTDLTPKRYFKIGYSIHFIDGSQKFFICWYKWYPTF